MTFSKKIITAAVLMATSSMAFAISSETDITINVTKNPYVSFTGSLVTAPTQALPSGTPGQPGITAAATNIGTLGTESNVPGSCDIEITSVTNDFRLRHSTDPTLFLYGANYYDIDYAGHNFTSGAVNTVNIPSCNNAFAGMPMIINTPAVGGIITAGTYSDTFTVIATTQ